MTLLDYLDVVACPTVFGFSRFPSRHGPSNIVITGISIPDAHMSGSLTNYSVIQFS